MSFGQYSDNGIRFSVEVGFCASPGQGIGYGQAA